MIMIFGLAFRVFALRSLTARRHVGGPCAGSCPRYTTIAPRVRRAQMARPGLGVSYLLVGDSECVSEAAHPGAMTMLTQSMNRGLEHKSC